MGWVSWMNVHVALTSCHWPWHTRDYYQFCTWYRFCDGDDGDSRKKWRRRANKNQKKSNLACLEELVTGIESSSDASTATDPWEEFPALRLLLKDRADFDSSFPTIRVEREYCTEGEKSPCSNQTAINFGPSDIMSGHIFEQFSSIWHEKGDPLGVKLDQLRQSWWHGNVPNMLETTPERPHIKHVIMVSVSSLSIVFCFYCDMPIYKSNTYVE